MARAFTFGLVLLVGSILAAVLLKPPRRPRR